MKFSAKWLVALFVASMAFGMAGCKGAPPEPPKAEGTASVAQNGAEISIVGFELTKPDFLDREKNAFRPIADQAEVAVLRVKVRNTSDGDLKYKPLHYEAGGSRIQICTDPTPDAEKDDRVFMKAIMLDASQGMHTPNQRVETNVTIPAGGEIIDEYLFEPPTSTAQLVALVPGAIVGVAKDFRFYIGAPKTVEPPAPARLNEGVSVDGVEVKVTKVVQEYAELEPRTPPAKPLKYAYGYTDRPVMSVYVTINNTGRGTYSYEPSHNAEKPGILMQLPGGILLKRVKVGAGAAGKGQIQGIVSVAPGATLTDVYYFDVPASKTPLEFTLAGKLFGVNGVYRYALDYTPSNPSAPDLEPYKNAPKDAANDAATDEAGDEAAAEEEPTE